MEKEPKPPEQLVEKPDDKARKLGNYILTAPNEFIAEYWSMRYPDW